MIPADKIDLIMKIAEIWSRAGGLPDQGVISKSALREALNICSCLPREDVEYIECQNNDELQVSYDYETNLINLWTADDSDASVSLDVYQLQQLTRHLAKIEKVMVWSEAEDDSERQEPIFNCDCC